MSRNYAFYLSLIFMLCLSGAWAETIIYDNLSGSFSTSGSWSSGAFTGYHVTDYEYATTEAAETATASWSVSFDTGGTYEVFTWYVAGSNRTEAARYEIQHKAGSYLALVDQKSGGSQWNSLGSFEFNASGGSLSISNASTDTAKAVIADAVKFVRQGTSYGDLYQAMWIYSWGLGFLSESETNDMIDVARANNLNAIFPEVRKTGDSYYISATEPRASNIDPAYADPLADIITKAHDTSGGKQYIEVHAWIVPFRVWKDSQGTPPAGHVLSEHPVWIGQQIDGQTTDAGGSRYLDPGVPAVQDYLVDVATEIVQNYDVDGIHWDYFRYPGTAWGYNPAAIARFNTKYGKTGIPATNDADFCDFRREQIRELGRKAYAAIKVIDWDCKLSAATIQWGAYGGDFTATSAYKSIFQDWPGFMSEGLLDMNVLMNYKREYNVDQAADYRDWCQFLSSSRAGRIAVNGPGIYMNSITDSVTQMLYGIDAPGIGGTNCYVYHMTNKDGDSSDDFWYTIRNDVFTTRKNVPDFPWLSSPTQGILRGTVLDGGGQPVEGATVTLGNGVTGTATTDGSGKFTFLKLDPGTSFTATITSPGNPIAVETFEITAGQVTTLSATVPVELSVYSLE